MKNLRTFNDRVISSAILPEHDPKLMHPDYGIVDLESANWINDSCLFSEKAQQISLWFNDQSDWLLHSNTRYTTLAHSCLPSQYKRYLACLVFCIQIR